MRITTKKGKKSNNLKMRIKPYTAGRNQIEVMIIILLKSHHLQ